MIQDVLLIHEQLQQDLQSLARMNGAWICLQIILGMSMIKLLINVNLIYSNWPLPVVIIIINDLSSMETCCTKPLQCHYMALSE